MSENRIRISELEEVTEINDSAYIPVDDGETTKKITIENYNNSSNKTAKAYAEQAAADAATVEANIATSAAQIREATLAARDAEDAKTAAQGYKADAQNYMSSAQNYAGNAQSSASSANTSSVNAAGSATTATEKATMAESYAVGGTNTRAGEDTDNSKYYKEQAAISESNASDSEDAAVSARDRAETAADYAESWSSHAPYVGENGHWYVWDIAQNTFVDTGITAEVTVVSCEKISTSGLVDTYRVTMSDGSHFDYTVTNGRDGAGSVSSVNNISPSGGNVSLNLGDMLDVIFTNPAHGEAVVYNANTGKWENKTSGHSVVDSSGTAYTNRSKLKFINATIEDDPTNDQTIVNVEGTGTQIIQIPSVIVGTFTYNGSSQGPTVTGLDSTHINVTGDSAVNAGSYTLTLSLKNPSKMVWSDLTNEDKTYAWSIGKASQTITLSKSIVSLNATTPTDTVVVSGAETSLTVSSGDTSVATASVNNNIVEISNVNETNGAATITVSAVASMNYESASETIEVKAVFVEIYGVEWDGSSISTWNRTDDATNFVDPVPYYSTMQNDPSSPFDSISPWKDMSIVEDAVAGSLVSIPKYYYKWTRTGDRMKLQIIPNEYSARAITNGYRVSPAHADRGDGQGERDIVYVGRYHSHASGKSIPNTYAGSKQNRAGARTSAHNLGADIWLYDYAMYWTIMMLYLVEYADWNTQKCIGYGCVETDGQSEVTGKTDSMPYHTGTAKNTRSVYGAVQYRNIEGLWSGGRDWCDGIYLSNKNIYCIKNPTNFSDTSGGTLVGTTNGITGEIKNWTNPTVNGFEYALFPKEGSGGETLDSYVCDGTYGITSEAQTIMIGASKSQMLQFGAFYMYGYKTSYYVGDSEGSYRIMKLPNNP